MKRVRRQAEIASTCLLKPDRRFRAPGGGRRPDHRARRQGKTKHRPVIIGAAVIRRSVEIAVMALHQRCKRVRAVRATRFSAEAVERRERSIQRQLEYRSAETSYMLINQG